MQYMIPLIVISDSIELQEKFVHDAVKKNSVSAHYVFPIKPEKTELSIDQIRDVQKLLATTCDSLRVIIFYSMDKSASEFQNALLKTLEEKNDENLFLMLGTNPDRILPTIRSRSKIIELKNADGVTIDHEIDNLVDLLKTGEVLDFLSSPLIQKQTKESAEHIIEALIFFLRSELVAGKYSCHEVLKKCFTTKELLISNNLNPQLAIDNLLFDVRRAIGY